MVKFLLVFLFQLVAEMNHLTPFQSLETNMNLCNMHKEDWLSNETTHKEDWLLGDLI